MTLTLDKAKAVTERLYKRLQNRRPDIEKNDRYYRGDQPLMYASEAWRKFHAERYRGFSDNWCGVVANSPAERLRVTGFTLPTDDADEKILSQAERDLWGYWQRNDLDLQSSQGFLASIVAERSFVLVWGDGDNEPVITWEDPAQVVVDTDPANPRRRRYALKAWQEDDQLEYATLYTPDEVWKLQRRGATIVQNGRTRSGLHVATASAAFSTGGWELRENITEAEPNPLGEVPVVEFPNRPTLGGKALSDISGTIAMQDAVNLLWAYLFNAADFASMPARVVMGQEPPKIPILDNDGQKIGEREVKIEELANGRLLWLTGQTTKIDSWDSAKLDVFTSVIEVAVGHIAAQTRTPPHYLVANKGLSNLSGDALKAAETGLVKKVEEQQLFFGPAIREVFRLCALVVDDAGLAAAAAAGVTKWRDAESRSESQLVDALQKLKAIGFPFQWIAERYGLSDTEIARLIVMKQQEADMSLLGSAAEVLKDAAAGTGDEADQTGDNGAA